MLILLTFDSSSILNKRHDYRHTYKIHQRKTHACNDPRIDESSFFTQRCFVLFRSLLFFFFFFFSFAFFFFYSKINFPSSASDAPVAVISFFSHIFFAIPICLNAYVARTWRRRKKNRRKFSSVSKHFLYVISVTSWIYFNKYHQNI